MSAQSNGPGEGYGRCLEVAVAAAKEAGAILRAEFHRPGGPRGRGGHCEADGRAEADLRSRLADALPGSGLRGEELPGSDRPPRDPGRHVWLVDPNDGTAAFLKGHRGSAVSVALLRAGDPVLGVVYAFAAPDSAGDLFAWAQGCGPVTRGGVPVRREWAPALTPDHTVAVSQSADENSAANASAVAPARFRAVPSIAYRLALAAAGEAEAAVSLNAPGDWDYAAGHALLRGAGGDLFDGEGRPVRYAAEGRSRCGPRCFGGSAAVAAALAARGWDAVYQRPQREQGRFGLLRPEAGAAIEDPGLLARAQGCLLGQLAGDALGGLVEFQRPEAIRAAHPGGVRTLYDGGHWRTLGGQPTDDSEMALMLARSLVRAWKFDATDVAAAYAHWYASGPYDVGGTTAAALGPACDAAGDDPAEAARRAASRSSQANGALMRVSPLGVFGHAAAPEVLAGWARGDSALTHPHPVCQDASALFAVTVAHAVRTGDAPDGVYAFARDWAAGAGLHPDVRQSLEDAASAPPADFVSQMGWVRTALQNAFHRLIHAATVEQGVVDTVMCGGDTDTNAAVAGALLGAVHGARTVPQQWRDRVLTCRPLRGVPAVRRPRPRDFWPVDAPLLAERLLVAGNRAAGA